MAKRARSVAPNAKHPKASSMVTITIKGPRGRARVMRCVIKGRRTEYACLPCASGKGSWEFKRTVTIMCCDEGSRPLSREVSGHGTPPSERASRPPAAAQWPRSNLPSAPGPEGKGHQHPVPLKK